MLRAIIGCHHIAHNVVDTWIPTSGYKISRYANEATYGRGFAIKNSHGIGLGPTVASTRSLLVLDLSPYMPKPSPAGMLHFGFKVRLEELGGFSYGDYSCWMDSLGGQTGFPFAVFSQWFDANSKVGDEKKIGCSINMASGAFDHLIEGVVVGSATISASVMSQIRAGAFQLVWSLASASGAGSCSVRDIWLTDDVPGDGITGRIDGYSAVPIVLDEATATGWTPDSGTILGALNAALETANPALVNSAAGAGDLVASLSVPSLAANQRIVAIQLGIGGKSSSAVGRVGVSLKQGANVTGRRAVAVDTTLRYGLPVSTWSRAPDGTPWTKTNVDATSVVITPDF